MTRREFTTAIKTAVRKRATRGTVVYCEKCRLPAKKFQIDHVIPDALGGEPVIENAQLLCDVCYGVKNPEDTTAAAKAKRREASHLSTAPPPAKKIESRGFAHYQRPSKIGSERIEKVHLPPRGLFGEDNG